MAGGTPALQLSNPVTYCLTAISLSAAETQLATTGSAEAGTAARTTGDGRRDGFVDARIEGNLDDEQGAVVVGALRPDPSLVGGDDLPADRQPEPRAAGPGAGLARLNELVEDGFEFVLGDADAVVANRDADASVLARQVDFDFSAGQRELDGVAQQVSDHLAEAVLVGGDRRVALGWVKGDREMPVGSHRAEFVDGPQDEGVKIDVLEREVHLAGFQLGEVQQVVDQREEVRAALSDQVEVFLERVGGGGA